MGTGCGARPLVQTPPPPKELAGTQGLPRLSGGAHVRPRASSCFLFLFLSLAKAVLSQQRPVRALSIAPLRCPSGASCRCRSEPRRAPLPAPENPPLHPPGRGLRVGMGSRNALGGSPCPFPLLPWGSAGFWGPFRRRGSLCFMRNAGTSRKLREGGGQSRPCTPPCPHPHQLGSPGSGERAMCKVNPPSHCPSCLSSGSLQRYGVAGCCLCAPRGGSVLPHTRLMLLQVVGLVQGMPSSSVL